MGNSSYIIAETDLFAIGGLLINPLKGREEGGGVGGSGLPTRALKAGVEGSLLSDIKFGEE